MFPILELENIVQIGDKTRLEGSESYSAEFAKIEIAPDGVNFKDCTDAGYLDWQFETAGTINIILRVTSESGSKEATKSILVVSSEADALYSTDEDFKGVESEIFRYLRKGRSSFLDKHREAKRQIIQALKNENLIKIDATDLTGLAINAGALKDWSKYLTLSLVFFDCNTGYGVGGPEYFLAKAQSYKAAAELAKANAIRGLDTNADGEPDVAINIYSCPMVRG